MFYNLRFSCKRLGISILGSGHEGSSGLGAQCILMSLWCGMSRVVGRLIIPQMPVFDSKSGFGSLTRIGPLAFHYFYCSFFKAFGVVVEYTGSLREMDRRTDSQSGGWYLDWN